MDFWSNWDWCVANHLNNSQFSGDKGGDDESCKKFEIGVKGLNQDSEDFRMVRILKLE